MSHSQKQQSSKASKIKDLEKSDEYKALSAKVTHTPHTHSHIDLFDWGPVTARARSAGHKTPQRCFQRRPPSRQDLCVTRTLYENTPALSSSQVWGEDLEPPSMSVTFCVIAGRRDIWGAAADGAKQIGNTALSFRCVDQLWEYRFQDSTTCTLASIHSGDTPNTQRDGAL